LSKKKLSSRKEKELLAKEETLTHRLQLTPKEAQELIKKRHMRQLKKSCTSLPLRNLRGEKNSRRYCPQISSIQPLCVLLKRVSLKPIFLSLNSHPMR